MMLRRLANIAFRILLICLGATAFYLLIALIFSLIPYNLHFRPCEKDAVEIYVKTNGVHTDLVLPVKHELKDWSAFINPALTPSGDTSFQFVAFGWGDKGFYLHTPTWADLTVSTALKAAFYLGSSAMHVSFYRRIHESGSCRRICIRPEEYQRLIEFIQNDFQKFDGLPILIPGYSYTGCDLFFEAHGTYGMFHTCNSWTNRALKHAGLKACLWTPFDKGIFYQLP